VGKGTGRVAAGACPPQLLQLCVSGIPARQVGWLPFMSFCRWRSWRLPSGSSALGKTTPFPLCLLEAYSYMLSPPPLPAARPGLWPYTVMQPDDAAASRTDCGAGGGCC
jgi:hypothetical protein